MNILYIDIDSLRADHLGCYGYARPTSPHIDRLAAEGVRVSSCYTSDAPCLPSRTALFSGLFGIHNGVVTHGGTASHMRYPGDGHSTDRERLPLPMALSMAGYHTVTFTNFAQRHLAWHFLAGWDEIHKVNNKGGHERADEVSQVFLPWLRQHAGEDKLFVHVNFWDPHTPYRTPLEYGNPLEGSPRPEFPDDETIAAQRESYGPMSARDHVLNQERYPRLPAGITNRADFDRWIDGYDVGIRYVDDHIGQIRATLEARGVLDDWAIIVSADHGENQGELNIYGDHQTADEYTTHIPLIIRWPGTTAPGGAYAGLVYHLDLAPTLCELLGVRVPERWDGRSFAPVLRGQAHTDREYLVLGQGAWTCQRAVRQGDWLLVRTYHTGHHPFPAAMLFDLAQDPHETRNVAESRPEVVAALDHLLTEWWQEQTSGPQGQPDPMLTTIQEGGPFYVRGKLQPYIERLRAAGRNAAADELARFRGGPIGGKGES